MSYASLHSRASFGTDAPEVSVEVFLSGGLPAFSIVGMAETAVKESKDRVRGALIAAGFNFPQQRITVSLAPADMKKTGGRFDLAIAIGILFASRQLAGSPPDALEFYGELSLSGRLRSVPGILPAALRACDSTRSLIVPRQNAVEAALSKATVYAANSLLEVTAHLLGHEAINAETVPDSLSPCVLEHDLADVRGQSLAKRVLEIAAAGGHNLLLTGPPGTGKTMLAKRLPGLLPPMSEAEALETAAVASVLGQPVNAELFAQRPFRAPHHSASAAAIVGGGAVPRPGEISRAHNGVLFLDELAEFNRQVLEVLREPLEAGSVCISRAAYSIEFPARFLLVAAMNPCPCGYLGDRDLDCRCSGERIAKYRGRISGPLLDRIDLQIEVARQSLATVRGDRDAESSATVARRVERARRIARRRQCCLNAEMDAEALQASGIDAAAWALLERASASFHLSTRAAYRVLKVARTIADLGDEEAIGRAQIAEALSFRQVDPRSSA